MKSLTDNSVTSQGRGMFAIPISDTIYAKVLTANTVSIVEIPDGARVVSFSSSNDFFAKFGIASSSLSIPTEDDESGNSGELNPTIRQIPETHTTKILLVSPTDNIVTLSFFSR